jgi:hypothetical protein
MVVIRQNAKYKTQGEITLYRMSHTFRFIGKNKKGKQKLLSAELAQYVHHYSQYTNLALLSNDQEIIGPGIPLLGCCNVQEHRLAGTMLGILHPRSRH